MWSKKDYYLYVFESKNHGVFIYNLLETAGHKNFQLVSAPCGIKAGCSYAIKFSNWNYAQIINRRIEEYNINKPRIFFMRYENGKYYYNEINS